MSVPGTPLPLPRRATDPNAHICGSSPARERRPLKSLGRFHHSKRELQYLSTRDTERLTEASIEPSAVGEERKFDQGVAAVSVIDT